MRLTETIWKKNGTKITDFCLELVSVLFRGFFLRFGELHLTSNLTKLVSTSIRHSQSLARLLFLFLLSI